MKNYRSYCARNLEMMDRFPKSKDFFLSQSRILIYSRLVAPHHPPPPPSCLPPSLDPSFIDFFLWYGKSLSDFLLRPQRETTETKDPVPPFASHKFCERLSSSSAH